jgi:hypothetical protein
VSVTIRIFGRWTARCDDGVWCVLVGPPEVALVLNAIADPPTQGATFDEQRLREARAMYPELSVVADPKVGGRAIH